MHICVSVCHTYGSAHRGQKSILGLPYNEPASVGGWSSARTARAVLSPTEPYISPALGFKLKKISPVDYQFIETIRLNNSCAEECLTFACTWSFLSAFKHNSPGNPFVMMLLIYSGLVGNESATSPQAASTCSSQHAASDWTDNWVTNGRAEGFSLQVLKGTLQTRWLFSVSVPPTSWSPCCGSQGNSSSVIPGSHSIPEIFSKVDLL